MANLIKIKYKQDIYLFAKQAKLKIEANNYLHQIMEKYTKEITYIKNLLNEYYKEEIKENLKRNILFNGITNYNKELFDSTKNFKQELKKLLHKYNTFIEEFFDEYSMNKQELMSRSFDYFILENKLKEKDDIIFGLNESIEKYNIHACTIFSSYEINVNQKWGNYYSHTELNKLQHDMMYECTMFNKYKKKSWKKEIKKIDLTKLKKFLIKILNFFEKISNVDNQNTNLNIDNEKLNFHLNNEDIISRIISKNISENEQDFHSKFQFKDNLYNSLIKTNCFPTFSDTKEFIEKQENNRINNIIKFNGDLNFSFFPLKKKEKKNDDDNENKKKINLLPVEELFDVNNDDDKEEAIIDDELHSDDETVFSTKVIPLKKLTIHYLVELEKQVPKLNLIKKKL